MSILSAIKQQSGSIEDLAKLPQTMIMQMAQRKEIVPEMVPAILAKKAEMIDRIAKNKGIETRNLGISSGAITTIIDNLIAYFDKFGKPKVLFCLFPIQYYFVFYYFC
jgi:hypothetical protein